VYREPTPVGNSALRAAPTLGAHNVLRRPVSYTRSRRGLPAAAAVTRRELSERCLDPCESRLQPGAKPGDDRDDRHGDPVAINPYSIAVTARASFRNAKKLRTGHLFLKFQ